MAIDYDRLMCWRFTPVEQHYSEKDSILYALGVGLGRDPLDARELRFLYEESLLALPTMAAVLGYPGFWFKDPQSGITWQQSVLGELDIEWQTPLPAKGSVIGYCKVEDVFDNGADRGALVITRRDIHDRETNEVLCCIRNTAFCRADGGFGGRKRPTAIEFAAPMNAPDITIDTPTLPMQAILYRLNGDWNPLHIDPSAARAAGFARPILHGLCTFGIVGHVLLRALCDFNPARLKRLSARFTKPIFPGEIVRTEIWCSNQTALFRCYALDRQSLTLDFGRAEFC